MPPDHAPEGLSSARPDRPAGDPRNEVLGLLERLTGLVAALDAPLRSLSTAPAEPGNTPPLPPAEYAASLIRSSLDMIISVDSQRRIFEFNAAAERTFGYKRDEVLGQPVDMLYADPVRGTDVARSALIEGFTGEVRNRRKNGEAFYCFVSASPLRDAAGRIIGLMGISRDITREKEMQEALRAAHEQLAQMNRVLEAKVQDRTRALRQAYEDTIDALVLALDTRELATSGHSRRVALYCLYLAIECGFPRDRLENVYRGALLHDIGKIGIPDAVLLKPGKLTPPERTLIEQHVAIGMKFLNRVGYLSAARDIPGFHHERIDGKGYPNGVGGPDIPPAARLFAIIDVYDALRSERPYKPALAHIEACAILRAERERHFDPEFLDAFLALPATIWERLDRVAPESSRFRRALAACLRTRRMISEPVDCRH